MRAEPDGPSVPDRISIDLAGVWRALKRVVADAHGQALVDDLRVTAGGATSDLLWQALFADCLRVVHSAVMADGVIEDREIDALHDVLAAAAGRYAAGLPQYAEFSVVDRESARAFLDRYAADRGPFGRGARLRWPGLTLCRRAAELGEREALQRYMKVMTSMCTEATRLGGLTDGDPRRGSADELEELRRMLASEATMGPAVDRRVQAFLAPCRVFSAVQQASSIFENDPFDVEAVHREARVSFEQVIAQAMMRPMIADLGRMLVVLGDSGAGKTHLLRGFRRYVQEGNRGFVVYAQLQSRTDDYSRYLLFHLIESLSRRYSEQSGRTGLRELAGGLVRLARPPLRQRIEQLTDDTWDAPGNLAEYINGLVDDLLRIDELGRFDRDLLRVLLYVLRPDPRTTSSVYKYLHCDPMSDHDRRWIGDVLPRTRDDDPHWMILDLARFAAVTQRALVLMVDQVDLAGFEASSTKIFRRAIDALYRIVSECTSTVAVIACLSDLYNTARSELNRPALDRLETAPPIVRLKINRSYAEIQAVVARRLSWLFAEHGTVHRPEQPVYPIPETELKQLENRRLRDVLEWCHQFQTQCAAAGKIITADEPVTVEIKSREPDLDLIAAAWSEAIQAKDLDIPDDEGEILAVVAGTAQAYVHEMGLSLDAPPYKNGVLALRMSRGDESAAMAIAVVNQSFRGGAFTKHLETLRKRARARSMVPIAVRTLEFPRGPACDRAMGQLVNMRGRGAYLDASTLRMLVAFQRFQPPFAADRISAWRQRDRPISSLPAIIEIFDFERSRIERSADDGDGAAAGGEEAVEAEAARDALPAAPPSSRSQAAEPADAAEDQSGTQPASAVGGVKTRGSSATPGPRSSEASTASTRTTVAASASSNAPARGSRDALDTPRTELPDPSGVHIPRPTITAERTRPAVPTKELWIGNSTGFETEPVTLDPTALLRHVAIVDGTYGGRLAAALNLAEQCLKRCVPVIMLDRTGEMSGYATPDWWQRSADPGSARRFAEGVEVRLFTPGIRSGRPLSIAVVPDMSGVPRIDHDRTVRLATGAVAAALRGGTSADESERLDVLTQAIGVLAKRSLPCGLGELLALIENGIDEPSGVVGSDRARQALIQDLSALLGNADVFTPDAELLTNKTLIGPGASGRVPLAILNTGFLGDGPRLQSWVAHLIGALSREIAQSKSNMLHAVLMLDGADLLLPTGGDKATSKAPLQDLLKCAGAAGLGVVLVSGHPAELDYRACTSIDTWFVGKTEEQTLGKMKALFDRRPVGRRDLSRLESRRFVLLRDGCASEVERGIPLVPMEQIGAAELKRLAARTYPSPETSQVRRVGAAADALPAHEQPPR